MRKLALSLLLLSGTAFADGQNVKITYTAKGMPKVEAALKEEAEKHRDKLETAANKKPFELAVEATIDRKGQDTSCKLKISIFAGGKTMVAQLNGGAKVTGPDADASASDCVQAVLGSTIDTKVATAIADKAK